jgi:SPP1 gp7 family putative phage head morphogenesis protein
LPATEEDKNAQIDEFIKAVQYGAMTVQPEDEDHIRDILEFPEQQTALTPDDYSDGPGSPGNPDNGPLPVGEEPNSDNPKQGALTEQTKKKDYRQPTAAETKTNVARLGPVLDKLEAGSLNKLKKVLTKSRDTLVGRVRQNMPTALQIRTMQVPGKVAFSRSLQSTLKDAFEAGRSTMREDHPVKRHADPISYAPQDAIDYLLNKAITVSGITNDQLLSAIQNSLLFSLKTGESTQSAVSRLSDAFDPFLGNDQILGADDLPLTPYRLENIVRTNTTDAFNQGRLTQARQYGVKNMQYSAIIDTRTTDCCRFLDGKVFPLDSPELDALTPPNHYNCRSILVALTPDVKVSQDEMITPSDVAEAKALAGKSFI